MRFSGIRLPLLAATLWASVGLSVLARDLGYGETVYVFPTSTTFSLTAPYVVPRSYVVPSSYVFPSYIATSYTTEPVSLLQANYIETTYRRGLFGRRWVVERPVIASYTPAYLPTTYVSAYVPTTYVAPTYFATTYRARSYRPTSWTYPTVWTTAYSSAADVCCDEVVLDSPARSAPQTSYESPGPSRSAKTVESGTREDPTVPVDAYVNTPLPDEPGTTRSALPNNTKAQTKADTSRADSPPPVPPAAASDLDDAQVKGTQKAATDTEKKTATPKSGAPASKTKAAPAAAPADDSNPTGLEPAPSETTRRDSQRPVYARMRQAVRRNILFGTVETSGGEPRGEVPIIVTNRNNSLLQHNGVSNAFGGFAIRIPDGQWTVKVTMPSGNTQTVRNITVTDGKVMDNLEAREVYNLIISY